MSEPIKMTARWVDGVTPPAAGTVTYRDAVARGLELRISSRGKKTWVWRYSVRRDGKRTFPEVVLGYYPWLSLADARGRVDEGQRALGKGTDPVAALELPRPAPASARVVVPPQPGVTIRPDIRTLLGFGPDDVIAPDSFGALAASYLVHHVLQRTAAGKPRLRKWQAEALNLRSYLLPHWRDLEVTAITRRRIHDLTDAIAERGSESPWTLKLRAARAARGLAPRPPRPAPIQANRIASLVSRVFSHALDRDWIDHHPAQRLKQRDQTTGTRYLSRAEILETWTACEQDADPICAAALLLQLFTGQRTSCVLQAEWAEFEEGWWTVPADREGNKAKRLHRVPLGAYSLQLLEELRAANYHQQYLFPHRGVGGWRRPGFFEQLFEVLAQARRPMTTAEVADGMRRRGVQLPARRTEFNRTVGCELSRRAKAGLYVRRQEAGWILTEKPLRSVFGDGPLTLDVKSWQQFTDRVCDRLGFRPHDGRRTMTTHMGRLKVPHEYKQQILGHTPQDVTSKVYDAYEYDDEKQIAMTLWHRQLRAWKEGGATEVLRFPTAMAVSISA